MKGKRPSSFAVFVYAAFCLLFGTGMAGWLHAFTSSQKEVFGASVFVTGTLPGYQRIRLNHAQLTRTSYLEDTIIQGESWIDGAQPTNVDFPSRYTPANPYTGADSTKRIRIVLEYEFVPAGSSGGGVFGGLVLSSASLDGPDPMSFAFRIPRSPIPNGILKYRVYANEIVYVATMSAHVVVDTITVPSDVLTSSTSFVRTNVNLAGSQTLASSGGRFPLANGNPNNGMTELSVGNNVFSGPTTITIGEVDPSGSGVPAGISAFSVYQFTAQPAVQGNMQVTLGYPDFQYPGGQDGVIDGTSLPETKIMVMWWDGFKWRPLGGKVNASRNTISVRVGSLGGYFAVAAAVPIAPQDRRPAEKIVTPNGDGINDSAIFSLSGVGNVRVDIFDVSGRRVRSFNSDDTMEWNGRDDGGHIVESGVYIYQYTVDGKRISGLIAVAK